MSPVDPQQAFDRFTRCERCSRRQNGIRQFRCSCGGLFRLDGLRYDPNTVDLARSDLLRYRSLLPIADDAVTLGAGWTPISEAEVYGQKLWMKEEDRNPTGSFKDRGMVIIANLARRVTSPVLVDSVGNTAAALAAMAHELGLEAHVFAPLKTTAERTRMIRDLGARLHLVAGPRSETAKAALAAANDGILYLSHIYQALFQAGTATVAFEIAEQLPEPPERVFLGVGQGSLFLGLWHGFSALVAAGVLPHHPKLYAVRPEDPTITIAVGASTVEPVRLREIQEAADASEGEIVRVPERDLISSARALEYAGYEVDPCVGLAVAGWRKVANRDGLSGRDLVIVTGARRETGPLPTVG